MISIFYFDFFQINENAFHRMFHNFLKCSKCVPRTSASHICACAVLVNIVDKHQMECRSLCNMPLNTRYDSLKRLIALEWQLIYFNSQLEIISFRYDSLARSRWRKKKEKFKFVYNVHICMYLLFCAQKISTTHPFRANGGGSHSPRLMADVFCVCFFSIYVQVDQCSFASMEKFK